MRVGIQTWGSEGDIRPFLALAAGFARRGHAVRVVATDIAERNYQPVAERHGFDLRMVGTPVIPDAESMARLGRRLLIASHPALQAGMIFRDGLRPAIPVIADAAHELVDGCDVVLGHFALYPVQASAEQAGVPWVSVQLMHGLVPSRFRRPPAFPEVRFVPPRVAWRFARSGMNFLLRREINRFRRGLGLAPHRDVVTQSWTSGRLNVIAVSPHLAPPPPDWPAWHRQVGFLNFAEVDTVDAVPAELRGFFAAGERPVFFGFGSLMPEEPGLCDATVAIWRDAVRRAGVRAVYQVPEILRGRYVPESHEVFVGRCAHRSVFPQCAAVVHHGGSGTTQAAMLGGCPSIFVPHVADQFFWADTVRRAGACGAVIPRIRISPARLAAAISSTLSDSALPARAGRLGASMQAETPGVDATVADVEEMLGASG